MSDDKKLDELPDDDWASALDEWEKTSFGETGKSDVPQSGSKPPEPLALDAPKAPIEALSFDDGTRVDARAPIHAPSEPKPRASKPRKVDADSAPILDSFPDLEHRDALDTQERVRRASAIPLADDLPQPVFAEESVVDTEVEVVDESALPPFDEEDIQTNVFTRFESKPPASIPPRTAPAEPATAMPLALEGPTPAPTPIVSARDVRPKLPSAPRLPAARGPSPTKPSIENISVRVLPVAPPPVPSSVKTLAASPAEELRELDETVREALASRGAWLAEEARLGKSELGTLDLLAASELVALSGDPSRARDLATAARERDGAPGFAWTQARLLDGDDDDALLAQALRTEADRSAAKPAKVHALRLAAYALRRERGLDHALGLLREAEALLPTDPGATLDLVAADLGKDRETDVATLERWPALAAATDVLARLRGSAGAPNVPAHPLDATVVVTNARRALEAGESGRDGVVTALASLAAEEGALGRASLLLLGAFGGVHAGAKDAVKAAFAEATLDPNLARLLVRRALEAGDTEASSRAIAVDGALAPHERAILCWLGDAQIGEALDALSDEDFAPLAAALAGATRSYAARSERLVGSEPMRRSLGLARKLADGAHASLLAEAAASAATSLSGPTLLEAARRQNDAKATAEALAALGDIENASPLERSAFFLVAAEVARAGGEKGAAAALYGDVLALFPEHEAAAFAVHRERAPEVLAEGAADASKRAAYALEAAANAEDDQTRRVWFEKAHQADPSLGLAAFLAERAARREGNVSEVLRWIDERLQVSSDPFERATDAVRDAMLRADSEPELAVARLREAYEIRPEDAGIRELLERMLPSAAEDLGSHRLARAAAAEGPAREVFAIEAATAAFIQGDRAASRQAVDLFAPERGKIAALLHADVTNDGSDEATSALAARFEASTGAARRALADQVAECGAGPSRLKALFELADGGPPPTALRSLRAIEQTLFDDGLAESGAPVEHGTQNERDLATVSGKIAKALAASPGGEAPAHAQLATRIAVRRLGTDWLETKELSTIGVDANQERAPLWSLRAFNAHARASGDDALLLASLGPLIARSYRSGETAALLRRASEAAARLGNAEEALSFAERAAAEDPADVVTWSYVADARSAASNHAGAAEAFESLARSSAVEEYQLTSWIEAARVWVDEANDDVRATTALEHAAAIDVTHPEVFPKLCSLYAGRRMTGELADLLERRLAKAEDADERVGLEVERARALAELGDDVAAKDAFESALEARPDHTTALGAYADLCDRLGLFEKAESAWVRLTRLLTDPDEQRVVYEHLADLYANKAVNLSRAEVALREVEKRAEGDAATLGKLVEVYARQGDFARAVETKQRVLSSLKSPVDRANGMIELAKIHEQARELRKAEAVLETARKEQPFSIAALRALAEFYLRQKQMPAVQILLDRVTGDAGRAFEGGRFAPELFELLVAAWELRGKHDAAHVAAATLGAIRGEAVRIRGAEMRAFDPRFDDRIAPEVLLPAFRALLVRAGDALDAATPVDLRQLGAQALPPSHVVATTANAIATAFGLPSVTVAVSPTLGKVCIPCGARPPMLVVGEALVNSTHDRARAFLLVRALKLVQARASTLVRIAPKELVPLHLAWLSAFNPGWAPEGFDPARLQELRTRMAAALPRSYDPELGALALEAANVVGAHASELAAAALAWADRTALLAIGDPNAAADAIAWSQGTELEELDPEARLQWLAGSSEARDLFAFSVRETYAELREACGIRG